MGEAKLRQSKATRMQKVNPWCIYCGGSSLGTTVDHMPPITICDLKQRPSGLEFLACPDCHEGTRKLDQIAGVLCRVFPDAVSEQAKEEARKLIRGLANNQPEILKEWQPSPEQGMFAYNAQGIFKGRKALNIGDKTHMAMLSFGARAAVALHYAITNTVVPSSGGVWVSWHTNERLIKGDFPADFAEMLPPSTTLGAGTRRSLEGQFDYSSRLTSDGRMSAHMMTFRLSFAVQAAVATDIAAFSNIESRHPQYIFRPGFLKELA